MAEKFQNIVLEFFNILQEYNSGPQELSWNNLAQDTRPLLTHLEPMTIKVTLHDGMLVTNPEQFTDEREGVCNRIVGRYHDLLTFKP